MCSETTKWIRSSRTAWQKVEDRVLVVTPQTRKIHILHGCAGDLWDLLERPCSSEDLLRHVLAGYDIDEDRARADVEHWIAELAEKGMIVGPQSPEAAVPAAPAPAIPASEEKPSGD